MRNSLNQLVCISLLVLFMTGCGSSNNNSSNVAANPVVEPPTEPPVTEPPVVVPPNENSVFEVANGCFALSTDGGKSFVSRSAAPAAVGNELIGLYGLGAATAADASSFLLRPSDLGKYLLYDEGQGYLTSDGAQLTRQMALEFDIKKVDGKVVIEDRMQSEGEWQLLAAPDAKFMLKHIKSGAYIGVDGALVAEADAAALTFVEESGCAEFPELTVDASGDVTFTEFEDGSLFGFVEEHSHVFTNMGFGGGGVFHGAPFHPLGVEHALPSCELNHGIDGRKDFMGATFNEGIGDFNDLIPAIAAGQLPKKDHDTDGYPTFTSWPSAPSSATHQVQYYKWIERAYLSGLRLLVQHATTNQVLCQLVTGIGANPKRYDCNDMIAVDRIIEDTYSLERYIDALAGGPGKGWFRIVFTPQEAREQIKAGNLAVVLGIETSDLFDCYLVPFGSFSKCTEADVLAKLDQYHAKGVRVLFPVHKFDNAFSAGDGDRRVSDVGNFGHTGHYSNFTICPPELLTFPGGFDNGGLSFANLNQPRDVYDSPPPFDMSGFDKNPVGALLPNLSLLGGGRLEGNYCQNHGFTDLGEFLMREMMARGMVIEVDHLPRRSYKRAFDMLKQNDYPAVGTHGRNNNGVIYELGGMSKFNFGRCHSADEAGTTANDLRKRVDLMRAAGAFEAEGFGFDLNGFAGAPGPRFGDKSGCRQPQTDPITYPFKSYAGDVMLEQPVVGNRTLDFNTEGMVHLGLVAELIEDARRDGVTDKELEPLFKSAEGYIRVWEKSERRAAEMSQQMN
jgi:microsomal dipeptidase-like Zn-dependent dipeptidase